MDISILLFASLQEEWDSPELKLNFPQGATARDLIDRLGELKPELKDRLAHVRVAINQEFVSPSTPLQVDAEIALIPPVSGG